MKNHIGSPRFAIAAPPVEKSADGSVGAILLDRLTKMRTNLQMDAPPLPANQHNPSILVREWLNSARLGPDGRLPSERILGPTLGLTRLALRRGLAALEAEGLLSRHVGRGTFLTHRPAPLAPPRTTAASPRDVIQSRLVLEPALARLAAQNGSTAQLRAIRDSAEDIRGSRTWPAFDVADERFHRLQAEASGAVLLAQWLDEVAAARADIAWGRLIDRSEPPHPGHAANAGHAEIVEAILHRDRGRAAEAATRHVLAEGAFLADELGRSAF